VFVKVNDLSVNRPIHSSVLQALWHNSSYLLRMLSTVDATYNRDQALHYLSRF